MSVEPYGADEESAAVLRTVGRVIKMCRERAGLTQAALGAQIGYSEEQVSSVERGRRAPMEEFLDAADRALEANGLISALKGDVEKARFPKKVRDLAKLEAEAVELCAYANHVVHGLLQTAEYARALYGMRRPAYSEEQIDGLVEARLARQRVFAEQPAPMFNFVQEEVTLRRPLGAEWSCASSSSICWRWVGGGTWRSRCCPRIARTMRAWRGRSNCCGSRRGPPWGTSRFSCSTG